METPLSRKTTLSFQDALDKITASLQEQGFGIVTEIDMKETLKKKLNVDFRNYRILGACNPEFAYQGITLESQMGLVMPCNVVVQEHENGEVEVSAVNPMETMGKMATAALNQIATKVTNKLRIAIDALHRNTKESSHLEALPASPESPGDPASEG